PGRARPPAGGGPDEALRARTVRRSAGQSAARLASGAGSSAGESSDTRTPMVSPDSHYGPVPGPTAPKGLRSAPRAGLRGFKPRGAARSSSGSAVAGATDSSSRSVSSVRLGVVTFEGPCRPRATCAAVKDSSADTTLREFQPAPQIVRLPARSNA